MFLILKILFTFIALSCNVESLKILGLFSHPGKTHYDVFEPILLNLVERGHHLTTISHFAPKTVKLNWKHINMGNFTHLHKNTMDLSMFEMILVKYNSFINLPGLFVLNEVGYIMCDALTKLPELKKMLDNSENFDIILAEQFESDCNLGVAHLLDAPVVAMQSHVFLPWTFERFDQPENPSYIVNFFFPFPSRMTFFERMENAFFHYSDKLLYAHFSKGYQNILQNNLNRTIPRLEEVAKNTSILLSNTHYTLNGVKPLVPAIVEVGGVHLKRTLEPLNSSGPRTKDYIIVCIT
ncbi:UDP-glucosyltransferase 2-like [Arctopsyche grandis]|uniref:UDP-glucosyltransferase 2-like n=1 Tax=Arctopsyche grandis TaxID=121162 RepID=UPI00406D9CDC